MTNTNSPTDLSNWSSEDYYDRDSNRSTVTLNKPIDRSIVITCVGVFELNRRCSSFFRSSLSKMQRRMAKRYAKERRLLLRKHFPAPTQSRTWSGLTHKNSFWCCETVLLYLTSSPMFATANPGLQIKSRISFSRVIPACRIVFSSGRRISVTSLSLLLL